MAFRRRLCSFRHLTRCLSQSFVSTTAFLSCPHLRLSEEVQQALSARRPVVALESTVITHGLPYPDNLTTAILLEAAIRDGSCTPATIAVMDGKLKVGLSSLELERISETAKDGSAIKVATRNLPFAIRSKGCGGTTVSATMRIAHMAGVAVFATGGIGGVHRHGMDISADLIELSRTPVAVVCAGAKSILDIPNTLEYLETHSVPIVIFGSENDFPGFYTRKTGFKGCYQTDNILDVAQHIGISNDLRLTSGTLVACPVPKEQEIVGLGGIIEDAINDAKKQNITGKETTPFLLDRVRQATKGLSVKTNVALLKNNASIGAKLAYALSSTQVRAFSTASPKRSPDVIAIGGATIDFYAMATETVKHDGVSYHGETVQTCGGVARNHADALTRLGITTRLIAPCGNDPNADLLRRYCTHMDLSGMVVSSAHGTASYCAVLEKGNYLFGIGTIEEETSRLRPQHVRDNEEYISASKYVVIDGNLATDTLQTSCEIASFYKVPLWYDSADPRKVKKIFDARCHHLVSVISPNLPEWNHFKQLWPELASCVANSRPLPGSLQAVVQTNGSETVLIHYVDQTSGMVEKLEVIVPLFSPDSVVSVSGAGDCFNSGLLAKLLEGWQWDAAAAFAMECASLSVQSIHPVPQTLNQLIKCPYLILIDSGQPGYTEYTDTLATVLKTEFDGATIDTIICTHWHEDHVGGFNDVLSKVVPDRNLKIFKYQRQSQIDEPKFAKYGYQFIENNHTFSTANVTLRTVFTPGHTEDHIALYLEEENSMFSGDCILGEGTTVFEDLYTYMRSLNQLLGFKPTRIYPGHGPVVENPVEKIQEYIDHRNQRERQILDFLTAHYESSSTSMDIVNGVYQGIPNALKLAAASNVKHHLSKLVKEHKVLQLGADEWRIDEAFTSVPKSEL